MNESENNKNKTLLVFNCHEAWIYQLGLLDYPLDIIVGLKGQYKQTWDENIRPLPDNSHLISLSQALQTSKNYYCIITNNITDLLDVKSRSEPRLIVLHSTLEGRVIEENSSIDPNQMKNMLHKYLELTGSHAVAGTELKAKSWNLNEDIVEVCCNCDDYLPFSGEKACGLRICNFIESRKNILLWDFHQKTFEGLPIELVGHNPGMPGVYPSKNWQHLKELLSCHRFYIHTAETTLEDGFNMACVEAMAAGMPVLGNLHPTSPIEHGVSGFLSDDPLELRKYANLLLSDRDMAVKMGQEARQTVSKRFSTARFKQNFLNSIETARKKWLCKKTNLSIRT
ncbi:glycosyltransferase [Planctomycetota bacterium]